MIGASNAVLLDIIRKDFHPELKLTVDLGYVNVDEIKITSNFLYMPRLAFARSLASDYLVKMLEPFEPVHISIDENHLRLVAPPVIEARTEGFVLCDGTHRVYAAKEHNVKKIRVLMISGSPLPLAGNITCWSNIVIKSTKYETKDNFVDFNPVGFTGYSKFFNSDRFLLRKGDI